MQRSIPRSGTLPAPLVILIGLAIGAGIGAIYGAIIAYTKIPPFIATLGAQLICRAGAKMYTSRPVSNLTPEFRFLGSAKIGPVPVIILVFFVMFAISAFLLTQTRFGKTCMPSAQRLSCPRCRHQCRKEPHHGLCMVLGLCGCCRYSAGRPCRFG